MSDLISRADAIEAVGGVVMAEFDVAPTRGYDVAEKALSALPSADAVQGANLINRHDAITVIREECWKCNNMINDDLFMRIMSLPTSQQTDCTELIEWLTEVVMDDEDWELNAVAYGEIICRKLVKLGVLEVTEEPSYYIRPSADAVPQLRQTDTLIIADALRYLAKDTERHLVDRTRADALRQQFLKYGASMCKGGAE